ncbi:MAG: DegT/DnrJ/EryC1/StrS family aminotransferase [Cyclobacteriaceae bacterium]
MEKIRMVDLHNQYQRIKPEIDAAIQEVLDSTAFIQGPQVSEFANALAEYTGARHVIPCANGTDALQIAMMALGFKPGDEIILPVHTYVATAEVIALLGLTPVFVDVEEKSFSIDVNQIKNKITKKTVAIVPVHLYGQCANMEVIMKIASEHSLHVIEDAAQALSAEVIFSNGTRKKAGTIGTIGTTSFFPSKNLGCFGDGGAIFTNDASLAEKIQMMANHGQKVKYHHDSIGVNSRLDTLQAAILKVKLKYLNEYTRKRNEVADYYDTALTPVKQFALPHREKYSTHAFHQYTIRVNEIDRDEFKLYLDKCGIPSMIYYPVPLHLQKAYRQPGIDRGSFPVTEKLSKTVISLPIHTEMSEDQLEYICTIIKKYF